MIDNRYVQLEYLESSGTQYIDTGYSPNSNTKTEIKYLFNSDSNYCLFGARDKGSTVETNSFVIWAYTTSEGGTRCDYFANRNDSSALAVISGVTSNTTYIVTKDKQLNYLDGVQKTSNGNVAFSTKHTAYLFSGNNNGSSMYHLQGKIYYCKIWDNNVLVRDFVPAKRKSDNVLGMFDKVNNVFYTNKGTGSFIGGKEIKEAFRSRKIPFAYDELTYIESSGTQYIDTGYKLNNNSILEIEAQSTDATQSNNTLAGVGETGASSDRVQFHFGSAAGTVSMRIDGTLSANQTVGTNKFKGIIDIPNKKAYFNGTQVISSFSGDINTSVNFPLFRRSCVESTGVIYSKARIYSFTIKENNALIRNFIPVVRKLDNVAGMYDLVEGKFYGNAGTGSFIAGDVVKTVDKVRLDKYEFYNYIQSSGTQYIDTGWQPTSKVLAVEFKVNCVSSMATTSICGSENKDFSGARWLFTLYGQKDAWRQYPLIGTWNNSQNSGYHISTPQNADVVARIDYNNGTTTCTSSQGDNWTHTQSGDNITNHKQNLNLFQNTDTQRSSIKMYSYKIWDNNVLVRNFYPAKRKSDGAIGMYDVVNDKLYTNAGTGEFTLGDKISITSYNKEFAEQYQVLDYIQNSGTQYIDTGILANGSFDADFKINTLNSKSTVFAGARSTTQHLNFGQIDGNGTGGTFAYLNQYWSLGTSGVWSPNTDYSIQVHVESGDQYIVINGTKLGVQKYTGVEKLDMNIHLFQRNFHTAGSDTLGKFAGRMYYFKLWNDGNLVRDYIPVKRKSDNAVGMYDKVEKKFYGNLGTESFIAGNELPMPVRNEVNELRLPYNGNKYKFFDYIESTGEQYIDTGKKAPDNTDIEIRFSLTSMDDGASNNAAIFGGRNGTTSKTCTLFYLASVKPHYFRFDRQGQMQIANATQIRHQAGDIYKFSYHNNRSTEFINETTDESYTYTIAPLQTFTDHNISLFGVNTSGTVGTFMRGRIYGWKYWENGELLQDFLPAQRLSDNAIGMYDKITNTFFENKGTGAFKAGNEIVNIPNEYERLEYLQSSGTQYIDVDLSADSYGNNEMVVLLEYTDVTASQLFGANYGGYFGVKSGADYNVSSKTVSVNTPYTYDIKRSGGKYTRILNGTSYSTGSIQTKATTSVYLFAIAGFTSMSYTKCKVKHFEYYVDGILVRNLFPVRRKADNVLGMLDIVNNVFYTNAGTGSFTTGTNTMPNNVMMPFWKRYPDVPKEYEVKEYLESDGSACINSGIRFTQGDKIDMVGRFIDPKHDDGLICMTPWNQGNSSRFMFACSIQAVGSSFCMSYNTLAGGNNKVTPNITPDTEYHRWTYEDLTLTIDDGVASLTNTAVYPDDSRITGTIYLFRRFNGACKVAIKYYNHWRNGQLIASYVPVMRKSDGVLGMYDIVTDTLKTNAGTGEFVAG